MKILGVVHDKGNLLEVVDQPGERHCLRPVAWNDKAYLIEIRHTQIIREVKSPSKEAVSDTTFDASGKN